MKIVCLETSNKSFLDIIDNRYFTDKEGRVWFSKNVMILLQGKEANISYNCSSVGNLKKLKESKTISNAITIEY